MQRVVPCPQCGKQTVWDETLTWRPFCSERCKLIDLGQWANEGYRIPVEEQGVSEADDETGRDE
jgi:uncharacterized protein